MVIEKKKSEKNTVGQKYSVNQILKFKNKCQNFLSVPGLMA